MTATVISPGHNEARLTGTLDYLDTGAAHARIRIYGGARPAAGGAPGTPLLAEVALDKPGGSVAAGTLTLASSDLATVLNTGAPTWGRIVNGNDDWALDADAGGPSSGAPILLSDDNLYAGGKVALLSGTFT